MQILLKICLCFQKYEEHLTPENKSFIRDVVHDKYGPPAIIGGVSTYQQSPLKVQPMDRGSWFPGCRRSGLIARKIGIYPMWLKDGTKVITTLLHVSFYLEKEVHSFLHTRSVLNGAKFSCYTMIL
jgi:large subunit ribosomal protein L3